jgi:hypothetical protein
MEEALKVKEEWGMDPMHPAQDLFLKAAAALSVSGSLKRKPEADRENPRSKRGRWTDEMPSGSRGFSSNQGHHYRGRGRNCGRPHNYVVCNTKAVQGQSFILNLMYLLF